VGWLAVRQEGSLNFKGCRIRCLAEHKDTLAGPLKEGLDGVEAHVGVHGYRVSPKCAETCLSVGLGCGSYVASFRVQDYRDAVGNCFHADGKGFHTGHAVGLEECNVRL